MIGFATKLPFSSPIFVVLWIQTFSNVVVPAPWAVFKTELAFVMATSLTVKFVFWSVISNIELPFASMVLLMIFDPST